MKLYATKQDLYDTCMTNEEKQAVIAVAVFNEWGELIGYRKEYID